VERLNEIQRELMTTVQELNKSQKSYREEQHEAYEAKVKASNVDSKYALFFIIGVVFSFTCQYLF